MEEGMPVRSEMKRLGIIDPGRQGVTAGRESTTWMFHVHSELYSAYVGNYWTQCLARVI